MEAKKLAGWQFWILDSGRMRTFIVAIDDFAEAQAKAVAQTKGGKAVSYRQTPVSLIPYLQLPREAVAELVSVDPAREPVPRGILLSDEEAR
jgi:autonomous glycyl radical cofactor GrcA